MERKFLVVQYRQQNKKISVEHISVNNIREIVKDKFDLNSPVIKYFDKDVDDWVDLETDSEEFISDLKIVKIKVENEIEERHQSQETDPDLPRIESIEMRKDRTTEPAYRSISPIRDQGEIHVHVDRPTTPSNRPETSSRSTTPSSRPTTPSSRPTTPSSRPTTPSSRPTTPCSKPETPVSLLNQGR